MPTSEQQILDKASELYVNHYAERKEAAAHSGSMGGGDYSSAINDLKIFREGIDFAKNGRFPDFLKDFINQAKSNLDPEWKEYQRLKTKFENA